MPLRLLRNALFCLLGAVMTLIGYLFIGGWPRAPRGQAYGITWSPVYARYLGMDGLDGLRQSLEGFGLKHVRLTSYWSEIEPVQGAYDWTDLDRELALLQTHGARALLVVGAKQPRWPECWFPAWTKNLDAAARDRAQLDYVAAVVRRYAAHPALEMWQVENEPSFFSSFGECGGYHASLAEQETALIKRIASEQGAPLQPIISSASGELSTWLVHPSGIDGLGASVYRRVANRWLGDLSYWYLPPWFYARKAALVKRWTGPVFVSEFQMEPWVLSDLHTMHPAEQLRSFDLTQMQKNLDYASRIDLPAVYFWGAEWWVWMKDAQHHPEFFNAMRTYLKNH